MVISLLGDQGDCRMAGTARIIHSKLGECKRKEVDQSNMWSTTVFSQDKRGIVKQQLLSCCFC